MISNMKPSLWPRRIVANDVLLKDFGKKTDFVPSSPVIQRQWRGIELVAIALLGLCAFLLLVLVGFVFYTFNESTAPKPVAVHAPVPVKPKRIIQHSGGITLPYPAPREAVVNQPAPKAVLEPPKPAYRIDVIESKAGATDGDRKAQIQIAEGLIENGDLESALPHLRRAVSLLPQDSVSQFKLATLYDKMNRPADALLFYRAVLRDGRTEDFPMTSIRARVRYLEGAYP